MKNWVAGAGLMLGGTLLFSFLFQLQMAEMLIFCGTGCCLLPVWVGIQKKRKQQKEEYYEMTVYAELLLCSYKRLGHIKLALQDCQEAFDPEGRMGSAVKKAIHRLKTGEGMENGPIIERALDEITRFYDSRRLGIIHHFISRVECMGGSVTESLDILLGDLQLWKRRTMLYQKKKQYIGRECMAASQFAILLCYISRFLIPFDLRTDIIHSTIYQVSTTVVLCAVLGTLTGIWYGMSGSYMDRQQESIRRKKSEVEREFPYWLLSVMLYLQQDSLYHALLQSRRETRGVFRQEVDRLVEQIYEDPTSLKPYTDFFHDLDLPELHTGMKLLYSVNNNGYQDTNKQIQFLVEQNNVIMDRCEREYFRLKLSGLRLLRQIPMMFAAAKAVTDVVTFFVFAVDKALI